MWWKGNVVVDDDLLVIEVVGDDADDVDRQRADLPAVEQVVQAMAEARHHEQHLHALVAVVEPVGHPEFFGDRGEIGFDVFFGDAILTEESEAHEEQAHFQIIELRRVRDVTPLLGEVAGDRGDDAAGRLAGYGQDVRSHRYSYSPLGVMGKLLGSEQLL